MSNPNGTIGEHPLDDLAAYALDALDDAERQAVDDHLERCPECRSDLAGHHETLAALGTTSEEAPPAAVWERVAAGIGAPGLADPHRGGPAGPAPAAPAAPVPPAEPRRAEASSTGDDRDDGGTVTSFSMSRARRARGARPSGVRWLAVAAAGLVVAAMTGGAVGYLVGTSSDDDADIGTLAERAGEDPEGVLATLDDSGGRPVARVVGDDDGAYLVLEGLQDLPEGRAYQLWSLTGPEPVSLGMLGRDGNNTVAFRLPPTITELAISEEPTIGEAAPTGQFEASGSILRQATPS